MEVDTGACVTIISKAMHLQYFSKIKLSSVEKMFISVTGSQLRCAGKFETVEKIV